MPHPLRRAALSACLVLSVLSLSAIAQRLEFLPGGTYDPSVPTPESVLGYPIGTYHTGYAGLERWIGALEKSPRVRIEKYGESYEHRPLYLIIISSPANLARLDQIRAGLRKLADPRTTTDAEAETLASSLPAVAWMNHANDGNESAAFESAIQTSYQLAAGTDGATTTILERLIAIVNPAHNPESHERFVAWYNSAQVGREGTADRAAAEHHAPWGMNSNNNHYQIDLNRDAFFTSQKETQHIVSAFGRWNPVVFVDHHGQTKNMFFPPPAEAVNLNVTGNQVEWMNRYGNAIADALDRQGASYYRRGRFDLFFAGFFDSWPTLNGSVGLTFETDGGGGKGLAWEREDGTILTLRDGVLHHHTGTMAVLKVTAENKDQRLRDFYQYKKTAIDEGRKEAMKQVVLLPGKDEGRARELVEVLRRQRIEIYRVQMPFKLTKGHAYAGGTATAREVPAGAYVIPMAQPQKRLAKALLELEPAFKDEFLANEERKKQRAELVGERPRDGFYDTTAWCLPLLFGVDAVWAEDPPATAGLDALPDFDAPMPAPTATPALERARYGYLFSGDSFGSMRATAQLLGEGFNVVVASEPFRVQGTDFPRGSVFARVERNPETLRDRVARLTAGAVRVWPLNTARVESGPDLGEDPSIELKKPRIAVVTAEPTDDRSFGAIWFTLEQRLGLGFTAIKIDQLKSEDLSRYSVIVFPHGQPAAYQDALGESGVAKLRRWAEGGGTLVLIKGAAALATRKGVEWTTSTLKQQTVPVRLFFDEPADEPVAKGGEKKAGDDKPPTREMDPVRTPGAILRVRIDPEHYLGYGYDGETGATIQSNYAFTVSTRGKNVAAFPGAAELKLAGFIWPEARDAMARTLYAWQEPLGRGQVVLFADDPLFRASQLSTLRLFVNAVLLGPAFAR